MTLFVVLVVGFASLGLFMGGPAGAASGAFLGFVIWVIVAIWLLVGHAYDCTESYDRNGPIYSAGDCS